MRMRVHGKKGKGHFSLASCAFDTRCYVVPLIALRSLFSFSFFFSRTRLIIIQVHLDIFLFVGAA